MAYVMMFGACLVCRQPFGFNPHKVPSSSAVTGEREPICPVCIGRINRKRVERGLEPFVISPDAYDEIDEEEL